jgi:hypothetical protein
MHYVDKTYITEEVLTPSDTTNSYQTECLVLFVFLYCLFNDADSSTEFFLM